jgi:Uma2 family endonuclease
MDGHPSTLLPVGGPLTDDELEARLAALPPTKRGEIIDGELYAQARPAPKHGVAAAEVYGELRDPFLKGRGRGPGGWIILIEPELQLGRDVFAPDLAGWRTETMPSIPDTARIYTPPDWVCEVLSPSTRGYDTVLKANKYAAAGIGWMWQVDPEAQSLQVFRLDGAHYLRVAAFIGKKKIRPEPFEAAPFDLGTLWRTSPAVKKTP